MFNVLYKDSEGRPFVMECLTDQSLEHFTTALKNANIPFDVKEVDDRKVQLAACAFNLDDVELIEQGKKEPYTFADPDDIAKPGDVVKVQCTDGRQKNVYVVSVSRATVPEIREFCKKIGYKKLGKVIKLIFRPKRK